MVARTATAAIQAYANSAGLRQTKPPASSSRKKWHPGHYHMFARGPSLASFSQRQAIYASEASIPQIVGYGMIVPFSAFVTGVVGGVVQYTTAPIIQDLNYLQGIGKYLFVDFVTDYFSDNDPGGFLAPYMYSSSAPGYAPTGPTYIYSSGTGVTRAAEWSSYYINQEVACLSWLASQTGGNLDAHPALEGITYNDETWTTFAGKFPGGDYTGGTAGPSGQSNSFSDSLWNQGQQTLMQNHALAWKQTNAAVSLNFLPTGAASLYSSFANLMLGSQCAFSGPDVLLGPIGIGGNTYNFGTAGQAVYSGALGTNYQGVLGGMWQVQPPDYSASPSSILAYANTNKFTHLFWWDVTGGTGDYASVVKPLIQSTPLNQTAYPSGYPQ